MRHRLWLALFACAACAPARSALGVREVRSDEIVLDLDSGRPPHLPVSEPGEAGPRREHGYGHDFDEDPLSAGGFGPPSAGSIIDPAPPPEIGHWKCAPSSTCEVRDVLELHKDLLSPCHARARLAGGEMRFTARLTIQRDGLVEHVDIRELSPGSADVEGCLEAALRQVPFPLEVEDITIDLTVPVRLRAPALR